MIDFSVESTDALERPPMRHRNPNDTHHTSEPWKVSVSSSSAKARRWLPASSTCAALMMFQLLGLSSFLQAQITDPRYVFFFCILLIRDMSKVGTQTANHKHKKNKNRLASRNLINNVGIGQESVLTSEVSHGSQLSFPEMPLSPPWEEKGQLHLLPHRREITVLLVVKGNNNNKTERQIKARQACNKLFMFLLLSFVLGGPTAAIWPVCPYHEELAEKTRKSEESENRAREAEDAHRAAESNAVEELRRYENECLSKMENNMKVDCFTNSPTKGGLQQGTAKENRQHMCLSHV